MIHPLRCRCGTLQGHVEAVATALRAVCYCRDCQAYARFLASPGVVDAAGGTEVVASMPHHLHLTAGLDRLACLSLSPRGLLRWFASCCDTPVGNTPRNPKVPYVGLVHTFLAGDAAGRSASFGPLRVRVNTASALEGVSSTPAHTAVAVLGLVASAAAARISGRYKHNPFFAAGTATPIREVRVLTPAERARAYDRSH